ncbi:MAG: homoserine kinase [Chloroflexi bacterium]|nr:homoserine kinase [Chloroflexota bacterium]
MVFSRVEAFAPATVANLGVGFDIMGLALQGMGDRAIVEFQDAPEIIFSEICGDEGKLPRDPALNVAAVSARALLDHVGERRGLKIRLFKGLPLASGLGSSAASAVVSVVALNRLLGEPFATDQLLPFCLEGEALVSGYHADNLAPCLLGGIVLVAGTTVEAIQPLPIPEPFHLALVTPDVPVPTDSARKILPRHVTLQTMIHQTGAVAKLVDALHRGDLAALGAAVENDRVVEPARACLMPRHNEARAAAKQAGAAAVFIGGAGPTLCAICESAVTASATAGAMRAVYQNAEMSCISQATSVDRCGAVVLKAD